MKKIWVKKANSFAQAEKTDINYYLNMSEKDRLETVQYLREILHKIKGLKDENRKRLRRVIRIIQ